MATSQGMPVVTRRWKTRGMDCFLEGPAADLESSPVKLFSNFGLQDYQRKGVCHVKSPSLYSVFRATTRNMCAKPYEDKKIDEQSTRGAPCFYLPRS